jgi:hypothetical protein
MSLTPENAPGQSAQALPREEAVLAGESPAPSARLGRLVLGLIFSIFALGVGLFLVIFPWMDSWNLNYLQSSIPALQDVWDDPYFRGVFTGAGLLNVYVACRHAISLIRRS